MGVLEAYDVLPAYAGMIPTGWWRTASSPTVLPAYAGMIPGVTGCR